MEHMNVCPLEEFSLSYSVFLCRKRMGGRGRGRGRGGAAVSFNIEQLGLTKGDEIPCHLKPPPLYPPLGKNCKFFLS